MKAIGYKAPGPLDRADALQDITLAMPNVEGRDLLVKINAVSVNPVDTKVRMNMAPDFSEWRVLGFDAAGVVEAVGSDVQNFKPGDAVFYAGAINRQGTNSEYHLVDERIVGHKPASLNDAEAAALPLTAITAWEMLFDRLKVKSPTADLSIRQKSTKSLINKVFNDSLRVSANDDNVSPRAKQYHERLDALRHSYPTLR